MTPQELKERIRTAVEADIQQFLTDSLTPDRGYDTPVDNVTKLVKELLLECQELRKQSTLLTSRRHCE